MTQRFMLCTRLIKYFRNCKMKTNETLSGFVPTRSLVGSGKDKQPYKEKSKDKSKKKDYSKERSRKRGEYKQ